MSRQPVLTLIQLKRDSRPAGIKEPFPSHQSPDRAPQKPTKEEFRMSEEGTTEFPEFPAGSRMHGSAAGGGQVTQGRPSWAPPFLHPTGIKAARRVETREAIRQRSRKKGRERKGLR